MSKMDGWERLSKYEVPGLGWARPHGIYRLVVWRSNGCYGAYMPVWTAQLRQSDGRPVDSHELGPAKRTTAAVARDLALTWAEEAAKRLETGA